jgi:hypothetical protein
VQHSNQPFHWLWAETSAQPTRLGWVQPTVYGPGQAHPRMGGPGQAQFFFSKRKIKKYFWNLTIFLRIFMSLWLISSSFFYVVKNAKSDIKISGFRQNFKNTKKFEKKEKNILCMRPNLSKLKNSYSIFIQQRKLQKKNVLSCILALITSLLKSREFGQYFKKIQKNYFVSFYIRDYEFTRKAYSRY